MSILDIVLEEDSGIDYFPSRHEVYQESTKSVFIWGVAVEIWCLIADNDALFNDKLDGEVGDSVLQHRDATSFGEHIKLDETSRVPDLLEVEPDTMGKESSNIEAGNEYLEKFFTILIKLDNAFTFLKTAFSVRGHGEFGVLAAISATHYWRRAFMADGVEGRGNQSCGDINSRSGGILCCNW